MIPTIRAIIPCGSMTAFSQEPPTQPPMPAETDRAASRTPGRIGNPAALHYLSLPAQDVADCEQR
jgi:hypothetical protein